MIYKDSQGHTYSGGSITTFVNGVLFSGTPSAAQLESWGYVLQPEPEPYVPTEEDIKRDRMAAIQSELQATDYLALKAYEGEDMSDHPGWKERRAALRVEYRELEEELNNV